MKRRTKPTKSSTGRTQTTDEVADELGVTANTVRDYAAAGCPHDKAPLGNNHKYNAAEVLAWARAHGKTGKRGRPEDIETLGNAKLRKETALAEKYELQVQREKGLMGYMEDFKRFSVLAVTTAKNKFLGFPANVTTMLEGRDAAERQSILESRI